MEGRFRYRTREDPEGVPARKKKPEDSSFLRRGIV